MAVLDGYNVQADEHVTLAWLVARLQRAKDFPSLKAVLRGSDVAELTATEPDALLDVFRQMSQKGHNVKIEWVPDDG